MQEQRSPFGDRAPQDSLERRRQDRVGGACVHTATGPLNLCNRGTLHATLMPPKWKGERWWIVALTGEVVGDEEKYGALSREIIGEAL